MFAVQLSNQLVALGHDCCVMAIFEGEARLPVAGKWISLNRPLAKRLWDRQGWKQLADQVKEQQPDIVQANAGDTLKFAVMSKVLFGWKAPIVFRNANMMSAFMDGRIKYRFNKFLLSRVAHVISVSES